MKKILIMAVLAIAASCGGGKKATSTKPTTPTPVAPEKGTPKAEDGDDGSAKTPEDGDEHGGGEAKKQMSAADEKEALDALDAATNEICACKDMDCATKVISGMEEKFAKYNGMEPSEAGKKRADETGKRLEECMRKLQPSQAPAGGDKK